jgi:hypothetical protein
MSTYNMKPLSCDPQRIKAYIFRSLLRSFAPRARTQSVEEVLRRLGLSSPSSVEDRVMRRVLMVELEELARNPQNGGMTL